MLFTKAFAARGSLRKSGFNEPLEMGGIMMLFILGVVMFPTRRIVGWFYGGGEEYVYLLCDGLQRLAFSGMMFYFISCFGFGVKPPKTHVIDYIVLLPALIVAVNNFPFISFFSGDCSLGGEWVQITCFAIWCVGVGFFEEVAFRGVIFPLCLIFIENLKKKGKKIDRPVFWTVASSSAVFALTHLVNLLNGNIGGTILQVGYTFLIGSMCGIAMAKTGNIFVCSVIHIIYNFSGMLVEHCGSGNMWTWEQIIFTAVVGVVCGIYLIVVAFRTDRNKQPAYSTLGKGYEEYLFPQTP